ncbi:MAG TPA: alpha-L-rhamnosidase C-terminal domain-containing protein [Chthoniobacteraceae bacterium]|nr:alpha-L-rhamnosidase C-terminal domain-containing protein [Chthoniobacteraceae bacterium]
MNDPDAIKWNADWIWLSRYDGETSCALLARKVFELSTLPGGAILRISAGQIYRLYLNGVLLGRGPDRADPRFPFFDTYEVAPHLSKGRNIIVALVYHCQAAGRSWSIYDGPGGLTVDLQVDGKRVRTGADWKMTRAAAWQPTQERPTRFRGPLQRVDLGEFAQVEAALAPEYDDAAWSPAEVRANGPGILFAPGTPRLVPVERRPVHSGSIRPGMGAFEGADPRRGTFFFPLETVVHPTREGSWLVYDFGKTMGGFPILELDSAARGEVHLYAGESLNWLLEESLILPGGGCQRYESLDWRGARYVALHFRNLGGPVTIRRVAFREMVYPFKERGDFDCSHPAFGKLWRICRETAWTACKDHPLDCGREQALWLADLTMHGSALAACFGDTRPMEKAVRQALRTQREDGVIPIPGPSGLGYGGDEERLPWSGQALHVSLILWRIYSYTGRRELPVWALPRLEKLYRFFARYEDGRGLLRTDVDGLPALQPFGGWNPMQKTGTAAGFHFEYLLSLQAAARLAGACGESALARLWSDRAERGRAAAMAAFWDAGRCLFVDGEASEGEPSRAVSITPNALAALAGAVEPALRGAWADRLRRDIAVLPPVSPLDASLLLEAFAELDLDLHFRDLLESYFEGIVRAGEPTMPEFWSAGVNGARYWGDFSRCHAYGVAPAWLLPGYLLGARPLSPGWGEAAIEPRHLGLESASGRVPTPQGDLGITWRREALSWELQVELPPGMTAAVALPKLGWGDQRLWHNGQLASEARGWAAFSAHLHRTADGLEAEKLTIRLETPGRHLIRTEAF